MSQDPSTVDKVTLAVSEGAGRVESIFASFLQAHPELAKTFADFGSRNDILIVIMVGLGLSFIVLLGALLMMKPRGGRYQVQPPANEELLFSKYAYDFPEASEG